MAEGLKQSWNTRSKKWVLFLPGEKGNILGMRPSKFPGVEVEKDKPAANETENEKPEKVDSSEVEQPENMDEDKGRKDTDKDGSFWL